MEGRTIFFKGLVEKSFKTYNLIFNLKNNIDSFFYKAKFGNNLVKVIFYVAIFVV